MVWLWVAACTLDPLVKPADLWLDPDHDWDGDGLSENEGDCDDRDPSRSPRAPELPYDDIDSDCQGGCDHDGDGDGVAILEEPTESCPVVGDCDDSRADVYPGAREVCDNLIDEDCDGLISESCERQVTDLADRTALGDTDLGWSGIVAIGDLYGGVAPDVAVGAQRAERDRRGAVYLIAGDDWPADATTLNGVARHRLDGANAESRAGGAVVVAPRERGGGAPRVWIGAERTLGTAADRCGKVYLVDPTALLPGASDLERASIGMWEGVEADDQLGTALAVGDFDDDGLNDAMAGAGGASRGRDRVGAVYLIRGNTPLPFDGPVGARPALVGVVDGEELGQQLETTDLDGDGVDDLALGRPARVGNVAVFFGPYSPDTWTDITDPSLSIDGVPPVASESNEMGWSMASGFDVDGDGNQDLIVGAPETPVSLGSGGAAYLVLGRPVFAERFVAAPDIAEATFEAEAAGNRVGGGVELIEDMDGDGIDDILIGAPSWEGDRGLLTLWLGGSVQGEVDMLDAAWRIVGPRDAESGTQVRFGASQASAGDPDGDGIVDLVVGSREIDAGDVIDAGGVWRIPGNRFFGAP